MMICGEGVAEWRAWGIRGSEEILAPALGGEVDVTWMG